MDSVRAAELVLKRRSTTKVIRIIKQKVVVNVKHMNDIDTMATWSTVLSLLDAAVIPNYNFDFAENVSETSRVFDILWAYESRKLNVTVDKIM